MHVEAGVLLVVVVEQVGHDGLVVLYVHAERDGDRLTAAVMLRHHAAAVAAAAAVAGHRQ